MQIPGLTEATIREHAAQDSYERGEEYAARGAVVSLKRTGPRTVEAYVKGSRMLPYTVTIRHDEAAITDVECTCPYHAGSWCKHIAATLLVCLREDLDRTTALDAVLDTLDRQALIDLIRRLAERHPEVADWIAQESDNAR